MKKALIATGGAVLLLAAGWFIGRMMPQTDPAAGQSDFPLLAKRLFIDNPSDRRINFSDLRTALNSYFEDNQVDGSLYFEYLPTGTSVRVNPDQRYQGASLIKLPVAMELFRAVELGRLSLDDKVALKAEWLNDGFGSLYQQGAGFELTLGEAAEILLVESDNTALRAIIDANDRVLELDDRALGSLDIEFSTAPDQTISIGTRAYSSFLKCLYFACYNNQEHSQQILQLLTQTAFNNRLVAGVDKDTTIAHKIGVFNTQVQSDCGIIYIEDNNYLLCVMLEGTDSDDINQNFAELSRIVFDYVSNMEAAD